MNKKRRSFLKSTVTVAASAFVLPRFSIGKAGPSANSKVNIAMIGTSGIANGAFKAIEGAQENIVALCDIDSGRLPARYAGTPAFDDYRVMLDKMWKEIDGVIINTPDHHHFAATIGAMERGCHAFTQKPLTHNIWQARTLRKAKHKYKLVTCMGNQGHTGESIRVTREWYEAGVFGQVREVHMGHPGPVWGSRYFQKPRSIPPVKQPIPDDVNWDLWLGPSKYTDYNEIFHPQSWRGFYEYGTGQFGDWFCHTADAPVWALDLYDPTVIECVDRGSGLEGMAPDWSVIRFDFPARGAKAACSLYWYDGSENGGPHIKCPEDWGGRSFNGGAFWFGDKRNVYTTNRSGGPRLMSKAAMMEVREEGPIAKKFERVKGGPHVEWVKAIKGTGSEPGSNFDYAAPMSEVALLGVLAQRFGGRIEWDSVNMRITNRPELNAFVKEPVREGWSYGEGLWKS